MAWTEILPGFEAMFRRAGRTTAAAFFSWTGILVNHHRHRRVEQVALDGLPQNVAHGASFFVKKQSSVTWHERFRNAWHGFGWCSTVVREGAMLQALARARVGCPRVAALGEDGRNAFLVLSDESSMTELREFLSTQSVNERCRLAQALGTELAKVHDAGFDHPDLQANHILAAMVGTGFRFCILDWQRGRRHRKVSWSIRCRDLAMLDATLHESLASERLRLRCLQAYCRATSSAAPPPLRNLAWSIRNVAHRLRERRPVREARQLPAPSRSQQFVPAFDGRILVTRTYYDELRDRVPAWIEALEKADASMRVSTLQRRLTDEFAEICTQALPAVGSTGELPEIAHTLFRLHRFGVLAPRLVLIGRFPDGSVVAMSNEPCVSLEETIAGTLPRERMSLLAQAGILVRKVHEAGYRLRDEDSWARCIAVSRATGGVCLASVDGLVRFKADWRDLAPKEFARQEIRLSRADQMRFLRGYLGVRRLRRQDLHAVGAQMSANATGERRAA